MLRCLPDVLSCTSRLSAHRLGLALPETSKTQWDKRDTYDALILLDWDTTPETFSTSKLSKLRTILTEVIILAYITIFILLFPFSMRKLILKKMICKASSKIIYFWTNL